MNDIKSGGVVPDNIIRKTVEYMRATSGIFASETVRRIELSPLLCDILGVNIQTIQNNDKTTADGTAKSGTEDMSFSCLFEEDINEIGDGGSDPSTQAGLSAARSWAQKEVHPDDPHLICQFVLKVHLFFSIRRIEMPPPALHF